MVLKVFDLALGVGHQIDGALQQAQLLGLFPLRHVGMIADRIDDFVRQLADMGGQFRIRASGARNWFGVFVFRQGRGR